jgi:hypothetical protein
VPENLLASLTGLLFVLSDRVTRKCRYSLDVAPIAPH